MKKLIFAFVRKSISAILLLCVYLVLVSHQLIHHHHIDVISGFEFSQLSQTEVHNHTSSEIHYDHLVLECEPDNHKKEHNHDFPPHLHFNSDDVLFVSSQNILKLINANKEQHVLTLYKSFNTELLKPPDIKYTYFEIPFLIPLQLCKEVYSFRGPPVV